MTLTDVEFKYLFPSYCKIMFASWQWRAGPRLLKNIWIDVSVFSGRHLYNVHHHIPVTTQYVVVLKMS